MPVPAALIFDVGKTNKKVLLFDEQYKLLLEESTQLEETTDEDGFACEDVRALTQWIRQKLSEILLITDIDVRAVNFSAYGASFVYVDAKGNVAAPLYNYLKPFPENLKRQFYNEYGTEDTIAKETASPVLGSLNSGLQVYRLKYERPDVFKKIAFAFHLPQFLSYVLSDFPASDITSIGCHTALWDFQKNKYHSWVEKETIDKVFAPILPSVSSIPTNFPDRKIEVGVGLHDSSAALIPYLSIFKNPFVLISTGTWNISLNPFNHTALTHEELKQDCLCYLSYEGKPIKASRLFAGYDHEQQVKRLAAHFNTKAESYQSIEYNAELVDRLEEIRPLSFSQTDLGKFKTYEEAYHYLMADIVQQQARSTNLVLDKTPVKKIYVDGGFGKNKIYMAMLAKRFSGLGVYAATISQASALGAALAIHKNWNNHPLPTDIIELERFTNMGST